jgi:hypothetical protein
MATNYMYRQSYMPDDDMRVAQIAAFVKALLPALGVDHVEMEGRAKVHVDEHAVSSIIERKRKAAPDLGVVVNFGFSAVAEEEDRVSWFLFTVGAPRGGRFIDSLAVNMGHALLPPPKPLLEQLLRLGHPFEAYLVDLSNFARYADNWDLRKNTGFSRPAIVCPFHFLGAELVRNLGGMEKCLAVPAFEVKPFGDGVVIRLVDGEFDSSNPVHLEIQRKAMDFLGL